MEIMFQFTCRGRLLFSSFHDRSFVDNYYYYWGMAGHPLYNVLVVLLINFLPMTGAFLLLHSLAPFSFPSGTLHLVAPSSIPIPACPQRNTQKVPRFVDKLSLQLFLLLILPSSSISARSSLADNILSLYYHCTAIIILCIQILSANLFNTQRLPPSSLLFYRQFTPPPTHSGSFAIHTYEGEFLVNCEQSGKIISIYCKYNCNHAVQIIDNHRHPLWINGGWWSFVNYIGETNWRELGVRPAIR